METEIDYIIVGQGIAGTMLAHFLLKRNKKVMLVDAYQASSASNVAAGLLNPITGRRFVKTWMADTILPFAETTYLELEQVLGARFYFPKKILKIFSSLQERDDCVAKDKGTEYQGYIIGTFSPASSGRGIQNPFGGIEIGKGGYVDIALLVQTYRAKFLDEGQLFADPFLYGDMIFEGDRIRWKGFSIQKVIFCEGSQAFLNPYFSWLPFVLTKGEVLTIHSPSLQVSDIFSKGIFILPLGDNIYKVGSTYVWKYADGNPTPEGRQELTDKLDKLISCDYTILDHRAGIRPTVKDRRPMLGLHPAHPCIGIFNGLGTKGASLAPFFAEHLAAFLEDGKPLNKEADIARFPETIPASF
jgi:glycine oxidase